MLPAAEAIVDYFAARFLVHQTSVAPNPAKTRQAYGRNRAGTRFYRAGVQMLRSFEQTILKLRADTALHGQLKVGMGPALSRRMLSRAIPSFQDLYPDVRLILVSINDPAQIADEGTDVFIRPRSLRQRGGEHKLPQALIVRKLAESPMISCASPEYLKGAGVPRSPADLVQHACAALLTLERDVQDEWRFAKRNRREIIRFIPKLVADGEALREIALAGCGIVRNLACNIEDEMRSGALVRVLPDWMPRGLADRCDVSKIEIDPAARQCLCAPFSSSGSAAPTITRSDLSRLC